MINLKFNHILSIFPNLFLLICFCVPQLLFSNNIEIKEDDKVIVKSYVKKLTFFKNKKKQLSAKLTISQEVESKTNLPYTFSHSIFFDDDTKVNKLENHSGRKSVKINPIISDYESDGIFHSDLKICYFEHSFYKKGDNFKFSYEKIFTDLKFLDPLYFNDVYPIETSSLIIEKPAWVKLDLRELNFDLEKPEFTLEKKSNSEIYTYSLTNLPAGFKHKSAPSRSKINAHLIIIPNSYQHDGQSIKLIEKVDDLYSWYSSLVDEIGNDNNGLGEIVQTLTQGKDNDLDKIKAIFYWVQDNIRYIAFESGIMGFKPESCQKVFNNKYGDCKGMANLTKEMLHLAGYDARLTWLGTADIPYDYDIPSLLVDNHMICTVIVNGEKIFLDPTEKYAELYNYAFRIQGQQALIEDGDGFIIERIPSLDASFNKESSQHTLAIKEDQLVGKGLVNFKGNRKTYIFNILSNYPQKEWEELMKNYISNGDKNVQTTLHADPNLNNRDNDFKLEYDIIMDHHLIDLGDELYINLESDFSFQKLDMPDDRNVSYEFSGKYFIEHTSILEFPEQWKVSYLPEAMNIEQEQYSFSLSFEESQNQVIYKKRIAIKDVMLNVSDFKEWNEAIKQLNEFYADQIILVKK